MSRSNGLLPMMSNGFKACGGGTSATRAQRKWDSLSRISEAALVVFGMALLFTSLRGLSGSTALHGQLLGASSVVLGAMGMAVAGCEHLPARTLLLVALAGCAVSTLGLMDQASRDVGLHCTLAEAHSRILHLEERVTQMKHDEMMTQVFFRMNEIDDILAMVQQGSMGHTEIRTQQLQAAMQDKEYIRTKVGQLKKHAASVLVALESKHQEAQANATLAAGLASSGLNVGNQDEVTLAQLQGRIDAVAAVLSFLDEKHSTDELTYEEYEIILTALMEGSRGHVPIEEMYQDHSIMPILKTAYDRKASNKYDPGPESPHVKALHQLAQRRSDSRRDFETRFSSALEGHAWSHPSIFKQSLNTALADLPQHCLEDVRGYEVLRYVGWGLLAAQAAVGYTALTAFVFAARKDD